MKHVFEQGTSENVLLLLHGTGEMNMIFCRSDVLSIRKQVCSGSEDQCRKTACPVFLSG